MPINAPSGVRVPVLFGGRLGAPFVQRRRSSCWCDQVCYPWRRRHINPRLLPSEVQASSNLGFQAMSSRQILVFLKFFLSSALACAFSREAKVLSKKRLCSFAHCLASIAFPLSFPPPFQQFLGDFLPVAIFRQFLVTGASPGALPGVSANKLGKGMQRPDFIYIYKQCNLRQFLENLQICDMSRKFRGPQAA